MLKFFLQGRIHAFNIVLPVPAFLERVWNGNFHMHSMFWFAWFLPIAGYMYLEAYMPYILEILLAIYLLIAARGVWYSCANPPGALWPSLLYRTAIALYFITAAAILMVYFTLIWL